MSRSGLSPCLVAATLFLAMGLRAQETKASKPAENMMNASSTKRGQEVLERFDKNGDGRIDEDERADAQEGMMKERIDQQMARSAAAGGDAQLRTLILDRFDRNKDGQLDADERVEAQKMAEDRAANPGAVALRTEFMKRFDRNSDGKLDSEETNALGQFLANRAAPALVAVTMPAALVGLREDWVKRFDRNTDGKIDQPEMAALAETLRPGLEIAAARGDRFDLNRDGRLSDPEWIAAKAELQRWLNGEMVFWNTISTVVVNPTPAEDQARLQAVAAEVDKRRLLREQVAAQTGSISSALLQSGPGPASSPKAEAERARLEAVSAEVARRRAEREAAGK